MDNQNRHGMDEILMARQKRFPRGIKEYLLRDEVGLGGRGRGM